jgi:peptide/nickel transport system permease protein
VSALVENAATEPTATGRPRFLGSLLRRPVAIATLGFLALLVLACLLAPLIAPYDPREQDLARVLTGPTSHNLLGTDTLGRDVLSRLLHGGVRSMRSVVEGVAVVLAIGVPLGLVAGYAGGWPDRLLSRWAEIVLAIPAIILILVVLAVLPGNEDAAMVTFGILGAPTVLRVVRGSALKVRDELYVTAARTSGLSHKRIVLRHVLPRVTGPIVVQATMFAAYALLFETGIAYLGLTSDPATPTWGGMVGEAANVTQQQPWLLVPPGATIAVTILALGLLGDAVRDAAAMDTASPSRPRRHPRRTPTPSVAGAGDASPAAAREDALLSVRGLSVALVGGDPGDGTLLVDDVSFDVLPCETLGIVGESGCGKSVTALALLRLLPSGLEPLAGSVRWKGRELLTMSDRGFDALRGGSMAYVSQEPQTSLDPAFTVGSQLVEVVRRHERCSRAAAKARALELLRLVELPGPERVARAHAYELSGGMAQRVAMAIALAGRPQLLIADEPTTALDVTVQAEILGLLRRLQEETGMAVLIITHNWGVVADLCDRTLVMYAGQVVEQAQAQPTFELPLHPYTFGLLSSHPALAQEGEPLAAMRGSVPVPGTWPDGCRFAARCRFVTGACMEGPIPLLEVEEGRRSRCIHVAELRAAEEVVA